MKFITILDPAIDSEEPNYAVFSEGQQSDIWIKWPEAKNIQFNETGNRNMLGYVWPIGKLDEHTVVKFLWNYLLGKTVFPDYFYPPTLDWWKKQVLDYYKLLKFDGLWIDMK